MDIIIDTRGDSELTLKDRLLESDDDIDFHNNASKEILNFDIETDFLEKEQSKAKTKRNATKDIDLDEFEKEMGWSSSRRWRKMPAPDLTSLTDDLTAVDKIIKKSVIKPGIEQLEALTPYSESERKLRLKRREEREKTKGEEWFNMRPPEMTPEIKHDLEVLQMRSALDPKRFYKKNDLKVLPKYFHVGKVVDTPVEYYSGRLTKKERKRTMVDELMADAEFSKYNKRKYKQIIEEKKKMHYKAHKHAKKLKGKKK